MFAISCKYSACLGYIYMIGQKSDNHLADSCHDCFYFVLEFFFLVLPTQFCKNKFFSKYLFGHSISICKLCRYSTSKISLNAGVTVRSNLLYFNTYCVLIYLTEKPPGKAITPYLWYKHKCSTDQQFCYMAWEPKRLLEAGPRLWIITISGGRLPVSSRFSQVSS
jgi:hypothetical protein